MRKFNCEFIGQVIRVEESPELLEVYLNVVRTTNKQDMVPLMIKREVLGDKEIIEGDNIRVLGVIRTVKNYDNVSRLRVDVLELETGVEEPHKNMVFGRFAVKEIKPIRETKTGLLLRDIILRSVIPDGGVSEFRAILWNDKATTYGEVPIGFKMYIIGRLQSREYYRKIDDNDTKVKVRTYEVSIGKVEEDSDKYAEEV